MQRIVNFSISVSIIALVALSIVISAPGAQQRHARISLVDGGAGVVVSGWNFLPRERVILRASFSGESLKRTVRASPAGRFTTQLADADTSCSSSQVSVSAVGARGSIATTRRVQIPDACGIVIQP